MAQASCPHDKSKVKLSDFRKRTESEDNPGIRALQQSTQDSLLQETVGKLKDEMASMFSLVDLFTEHTEKVGTNNRSPLKFSPDVESSIKFILRTTKYTPDEKLRFHTATVLRESGFLAVCQKIWEQCHKADINLFHMDNSHVFKILKLCLYIVWNISDISAAFCLDLCDSGFVKTFQLALSNHCRTNSDKSLINYKPGQVFLNNDRVVSYVKCILGILHNVVRQREESHPILRQNLHTLVSFCQSDQLMVKTKAILILSYLVKDSERSMIVLNLEAINFMTLLLQNALESPYHFSTKYGISAAEVARGLNNVAANEANKSRIIESGCLLVYVTMLQPDCTDEEHLIATRGIWILSFCHNKRQDFEHSGCIQALIGIEKNGNEDVCHAARGALWELQNPPLVEPELCISAGVGSIFVNPPDVEHVMISYQWDSKPIMLKLKDRLKSVGYKVWMDVEHMSGSTLEAMALAVERAAVVVVAMSKKYKDSPNCRTEAEYTHKLHKAVLPLQVEENYIPDGWLGMLVGTRLYIPVLNPAHVEVAFSKITSELGSRGKPVLTHYNQDRKIGNDVPSGALRNLDDWRQWDEKSVSEWLKSTGMTNHSKFPDMDGSLLYEVRKIAEKAPDYLYQTLQSELKLSFKEILQLSKALSSLDKDN